MSLLRDTLEGRSGRTLWYFKSAKRAFRSRLPPKVTCQVSKTSISHETSFNIHSSSLQNEHFARDFLQNSLVKSPKRAFRARLPQKLTLEVCKTGTFASTTTRNLTTPCACHENLRVHTSDMHKVLRLPQNLTSATPRNLLPLPRLSYFHTSRPAQSTAPATKK